MSMAFEPSGVVTLTTDFGNKGPFLATIKGVILQHFAGANIVDLTHDSFHHWTAEAGFWVERSYRYFPAGTVHLAVVDPGGLRDTNVIVLIRDGHAFLGPDNGLLAPVADGVSGCDAYRVDVRAQGLPLEGSDRENFLGRDVYAPLAARLAAGEVDPTALGEPIDEVVPSVVPEAEHDDKQIIGTVIAVDPFGNLVTNIGAELLEGRPGARVKAGGQEFELHRTYSDVVPGQYLALINSFGVLEIARSQQSAADALGIGRGAPVAVTTQPR